jgi:ATP-dependent exoDNAse (exonuclease V) beta subunit
VFSEGGYSVVWWDPGALSLGAKPLFGVRREELIVKDVPRSVIADGRSKYDRWHLARADAREAASVPSIAALTVREWIAMESKEGSSALVSGLLVEPSEVKTFKADLREEAFRPRGAAFGALVHAVLAEAPFESSLESLDGLALAEARALGMSDVDASAAIRVVKRVLAHDLLMRARSAAARGACRRETPVTYAMPEGTILEGVVDLAFEEDGRWTVVDYKTDFELAAAGEERYRRQVALYASAIARATGSACNGVLMVI